MQHAAAGSGPAGVEGGSVDGSGPARVCIISQRQIERAPVRCTIYEYERVIQEVDGVDLLAPVPTAAARPAMRVISRAAGTLPALTRLNPGLRPVRLDRPYELVIIHVMYPRDLLSLAAVRHLREMGRRVVCIIEEVWAHDVAAWRSHLARLRGVDHVFVSSYGSVAAVAAATGAPTSFLPPGVDAERFCPYPAAPERVVDVHHVGRRTPEIHAELLGAMLRGERYYSFDTIRPQVVNDVDDHRVLLAEALKRSRYVICRPGKFNRIDETGGQQEFGFRYFEGSAAGTVMVGEPADNPAFAEAFPWPDAIVPVRRDGILATLRALEADPVRVARIRRDNVVGALQRHDWARRYRTLLDTVGLAPLPALVARERRLDELVAATEHAYAGLDDQVAVAS